MSRQIHRSQRTGIQLIRKTWNKPSSNLNSDPTDVEQETSSTIISDLIYVEEDTSKESIDFYRNEYGLQFKKIYVAYFDLTDDVQEPGIDGNGTRSQDYILFNRSKQYQNLPYSASSDDIWLEVKVIDIAPGITAKGKQVVCTSNW
jgi:hypothetical protein